jgi:cell division protease FtsH
MSPKEKEITAYHEAGHALVAHILPNIEPVRKISIIPRGLAGGYTKTLSEDKEYMMRSYIKESLAMALGGRAAEELIFNEITTGAQMDIKQATVWARRMVTDYGMSDKLGPRSFGDKQELIFLGREISEQRDYSEKTANAIDREVDAIIKEAHDTATKILTDNKAKLIEIAEKLITEETLEGEDLDVLFGQPKSSAPVKPTPVPATAKVEATTEKAKPGRRSKKAPIITEPLPKQAPAPSD